jgi:GNAT superfamily N-acetyltransferase
MEPGRPVGQDRVMVTVRAMFDTDVCAARSVWDDAYAAMAAEYRLEQPERSEERDQRLQNRMRHFLETDPGGSFVAEADGTVVAFSQSFVREGYWVLSLLATLPHRQGLGLGRRLLDATLDTVAPDAPGTIQASRDPSAVALYSSAGFSCHPALLADGVIRGASADARVRRGGVADIETVDAIDRVRRGSARGVDIEHMVRDPGNRLLVMEDRGYAVAKDDRLVTLGALDEEAAVALLETVLADIPDGARVEIGWLTSAQQWAIATLVRAGVGLHPHGAVMVRAMPGPPTPYIPSGGYG